MGIQKGQKRLQKYGSTSVALGNGWTPIFHFGINFFTPDSYGQEV